MASLLDTKTGRQDKLFRRAGKNMKTNRVGKKPLLKQPLF
jgi:hypothetical protein